MNAIRYKLILEYDGSNFLGWQRQKYSANSIQELVEQAIRAFTGEQVTIFCGGRTDAGVHATGQVIHFDLSQKLVEYTVRDAVNFHLRPYAVSVLSAEVVSSDFHARFSAMRRYYEYLIINRYAPLALNHKRAWRVGGKLDLVEMEQALQHLLGNHDFSSFRSTECQASNPVRTLDQISVHCDKDWIKVKLAAKSFLHNQVRIIIGTAVECARGRFAASNIPTILEMRNRRAAGITAPPYGLYLTKIDY